ncbi:MAG: acetyl-CoA carboxylase biotin carboxyl carrier protein [Pirellulales bacterium]|nr:acetyl-CoA carboxylase biotin carboxyl carrier protein [Pirellulales bacterium]
MTNPASGGGDIFDVKKVRRLVELMKEHDLAEVDLRQGEQRVRIRRGAEAFFAQTPMMAAPVASQPAAPAGGGEAKAAAPAAGGDYAVIKSPMVGTFYSAANPESPPFVKVGDHVGPDSIVCIIEAMKVFNEIPAEMSGKIVALLVENGAPVEFGQPLFKIDAKK